MNILIPKLLLTLVALGMLVNGAYELFFTGNASDAAVSLSLCAIILNWYLDIAKQDKRI